MPVYNTHPTSNWALLHVLITSQLYFFLLPLRPHIIIKNFEQYLSLYLMMPVSALNLILCISQNVKGKRRPMGLLKNINKDTHILWLKSSSLCRSMRCGLSMQGFGKRRGAMSCTPSPPAPSPSCTMSRANSDSTSVGTKPTPPPALNAPRDRTANNKTNLVTF